VKTLQVLPSLELGGVERGVVDLARALKTRGEEMVVVSSGGSMVAQLNKLGVRHYTLPVHKKSLMAFPLVDKLAEIIQREHIDVVHGRSRVPAWIAWMAAQKARVPFVTTCHGYYSDHFFSRVMGWGKRVIVISRVVGRHMIDDFGVPPDKIRLIHRGIDLSQFTFVPDKYNAPRKTLRIINVGRLSPIKGQLDFLRAVHHVRREIPHLEVWIVGSEGKGKTRYTELLQQTSRQMGLDSCVKFLGTRRDIPELLAQSDLLVLATRIPEAFGRVVVEAGAVGTAVVATRVGGVLDIVDEGENGLLVPPGDVQALTRAMVSLLKDPARSKRFAFSMRAKVEKHFGLDQMVDKTLEVYREVKAEKKILIIKLGAMGDLILAVPSFRMLRERFPEARISLLADRKLAPSVSACPYLDEVIPVDRSKISKPAYLFRLAKRLRREGFDVSVDLQNSKWTHLLAFFSGARERAGFKRGRFGFLLNRFENPPKAAESPVRNQFRVLSKLGVNQFDEKLELWTTPRAEQNASEWFSAMPPDKTWVGFVMGSSPQWETKRWPIDSFRLLSERLMRELNCGIVLLGSRDDIPLAYQFLKEPAQNVLDLTGRTSPKDLIAVVKKLGSMVSGDTAPLHVAAAVGTPVAALFGPTDPKRHMPPAHDAAVFAKRLPCQPCYKGRCHNSEKMACLNRISVDEVFDAVKKQLSRAAVHSGKQV